MSRREKSGNAPKNAWGNVNTSSQHPTNTATANKSTKNQSKKQQPSQKSEDKFREAHHKHLESAKKLIQNYESSSDEEEVAASDEIVSSVFKSYTGDSHDLSKTQQFLEDVFQSGTAICLICIGSVKRTDEIWSCQKCYTFFHLQCTQRWSRDSVSQKQIHQDLDQGYYNNLGEFVPKKNRPIVWDCPKCRTTYASDDIPRHYECFCKKEINPPHHPWLIPHSCGETCGKPLQPECGHKCVLLCHPGPCPPCPQMILKSCKCENSAAKMIRCSTKTWTCMKKCGRNLGCSIHVCEQICHSKSECPPCKKKSRQSCLCGAKNEERNCSQSSWKCGRVCSKAFACGRHKCERVCHAGDCGECPLGKRRSCPCGKQFSVAPCSETMESCGDTCQKLLSCGVHNCAQRCHRGECSQCLEIVEKRCRCGQNSRETVCSKAFTCESKCKQMRECKKHPCNRKCCDGQCPPCDKVCGKTLSCSAHKCQSLCHDGPCYPCPQKVQIKCRCGGTVMSIPCGRKKRNLMPKCLLPCRIASKCHHENPHKCHPNDCPTCTQVCGLRNATTGCQHLCEARCHDAVKVLTTDKNFKPALPWEVQAETYEEKKLPHPECKVKVPVICLGGHEEAMWPCHNSKPSSCQRLCGRQLKCGNHLCQAVCHTVVNIKSKQEEDTCQPCQEGCQFKRSNGCIHPCKRPCHPPPCAPCTVNIKTQCHCGLTQVFYKCGEFYRPTESEEERNELDAAKEKLLSCGGRCLKIYHCGHRCVSMCHSGKCPNPEQCKKKLKIVCPCKNLKSEITCERQRREKFVLKCDATCDVRKREIKEETRKREAEMQKVEEEQRRAEVEEFEKKFGKKKPKERKRVVVEEKKNNNSLLYGGVAAAVVILAAVLIYFLQ